MQLITSKVFKKINSVTDNPNIFIESDQIISEVIFTDNHWHWHWTFIAIALAELGSISEEEPIN
jgi:histidine ammonia-lyase